MCGQSSIKGTSMHIVTTISAARDAARQWRREGLRVGIVPTMGYLHEGHASLIERSVSDCDRTVVSIFVNPIQFGPNEDLASYPRDLKQDTALCEGLGVDLIFHPTPAEMYPEGFCTVVDIDGLDNHLCGKRRPGHFRGVCTVVSKLFHIVQPERAYFGQKDAQQVTILTRMVRDLDMDIELVRCPIIREADGLAKSSRNAYLTEQERAAAPVLHRALTEGEALLRSGERDTRTLIRRMTDVIEAEPLARIDYVEIVDAASLQPVTFVEGPVLAAMAVYFGKTRLIDNYQTYPEKC